MEGFSAPIHKSLTDKILIMGVPRELAILNGTIGAAVTFGLQSLWAIPFFLLCHLSLVAWRVPGATQPEAASHDLNSRPPTAYCA